ncbi:MAG: hypothetical protein ASARMPRED_000301 [Alectoria sarmentosa]|nr:MAG: hypothetical protein ASARMPRED_000301 [Alectoria sarmentosa]
MADFGSKGKAKESLEPDWLANISFVDTPQNYLADEPTDNESTPRPPPTGPVYDKLLKSTDGKLETIRHKCQVTGDASFIAENPSLPPHIEVRRTDEKGVQFGIRINIFDGIRGTSNWVKNCKGDTLDAVCSRRKGTKEQWTIRWENRRDS